MEHKEQRQVRVHELSVAAYVFGTISATPTQSEVLAAVGATENKLPFMHSLAQFRPFPNTVTFNWYVPVGSNGSDKVEMLDVCVGISKFCNATMMPSTATKSSAITVNTPPNEV